MTRRTLDPENQAESEPALDDVVDGDAVPEVVQYRGDGSSVTVDDFGLSFGATDRNGRTVHEPRPVATEEALRSGDAPDDAVMLPVAVELVRTNNLFGFGVVCEHEGPDGGPCGEVFKDRQALDGHLSSHTDGGGGD